MKPLLIVLFTAFFAACNTIDVYEKQEMFSSHAWPEQAQPSFTFNIEDTAALYNVYLVLRHQDAYRYNNIWLNITMQGPDTTMSVRREFILANNQQGWLGRGMDDIFEHRIPFNSKPGKFTKGAYTFTLQQVMREDPLQYVLNVGIRVEKAKPQI